MPQGTLVIFENQRINQGVPVATAGGRKGTDFDPERYFPAITGKNGTRGFLMEIKKKPDLLRSFGGSFEGMPSRVCPGKAIGMSEMLIFASVATAFEMSVVTPQTRPTALEALLALPGFGMSARDGRTAKVQGPVSMREHMCPAPFGRETR